MVGDSAYDTLAWHDLLLTIRVMPIALYNPRNIDDPLDIEYRVEDLIEKHGEDVQMKQSVLDETYNRRSQVERMNEAVKDCGFETLCARDRVHARAQAFLALCLQLAVAVTNEERGDNPGSTDCERYSLIMERSQNLRKFSPRMPSTSDGENRRSSALRMTGQSS